MARKTVVTLIDDIDGDEAERTVTFSLDGKTYEIDLNRSNIEALTTTLDPFIKAARTRGKRRTPSSGQPPNDLADVRVWARSNGYEISDRGRIPTAVVTAYKQRS